MTFDADRIHTARGRAVRLFLSPWLYHGFRLFIGGLFLYAGAVKLTETSAFAATISAYRLLPHPLVGCAALGLPAVEVVAGVGTLLNRRWAILGILAMMVLFLGVLGYGAAMGLDIDCGCFSVGKSPSSGDAAQQQLELAPSTGPMALDGPIALVEPSPPAAPADGTCGETGDGGARLRAAFYRDTGLFAGVIYLAGWPGARRRWAPPREN